MGAYSSVGCGFMVKIPVMSMMVAVAETPVAVSSGPANSMIRVSRTRFVGTAPVSLVAEGDVRSALVVWPIKEV